MKLLTRRKQEGIIEALAEITSTMNSFDIVNYVNPDNRMYVENATRSICHCLGCSYFDVLMFEKKT